jgi:hypothetical protein
MCRSIKLLRTDAELAEHEAIRAGALQYVRKISGVRKPSQAQLTAFEAAIDEIATASSDLLASLDPKAATAA